MPTSPVPKGFKGLKVKMVNKAHKVILGNPASKVLPVRQVKME